MVQDALLCFSNLPFSRCRSLARSRRACGDEEKVLHIHSPEASHASSEEVDRDRWRKVKEHSCFRCEAQSHAERKAKGYTRYEANFYK